LVRANWRPFTISFPSRLDSGSVAGTESKARLILPHHRLFGLARLLSGPKREGVASTNVNCWLLCAYAGVALLCSGTNMNAVEASLPALRLVDSKRPLVIGHRGYSQIAPENTLPSFKLAMTAGADLVELDYFHSKDNKLI